MGIEATLAAKLEAEREENARLRAEVERLRAEKPRLDEFAVKDPFGLPMVAGTLRHNAYAKGWEHGALDHMAASAFYDAVRAAGVFDCYESGLRSGKSARARAWNRAALAREDGAP